MRPRTLVALSLWLGLVTSAQAQFAVEDVYVGAQTMIAALESVKQTVGQGIQIANEAAMLKNQLEQLAYDAANLTQSPLQLVTTLQGLMGQYDQLLAQAPGLGFQEDGLAGRADTLYPGVGAPVTSLEDGLQQVRAWLSEIRSASLTATLTQAVVPRLRQQRANAQAALLQSANAPGQLAVQQDGNQILGIIVEQNASLQQMQAASGRVQTAHTQMQVQMADQAQQAAAQHVSGMGAMQEVQPLGIPQFR